LSSNPDIVAIDAVTGIAIALSSGSATVHYRIPDHFSAQTDVKVESISSISINYDQSQIITNVPLKGDTGYIVPVTLSNDYMSSSSIDNMVAMEGVLLFDSLGLLSQRVMSCVVRFSFEMQGSLKARELFDVKPGLMSG